jgi:hypothetical protein
MARLVCGDRVKTSRKPPPTPSASSTKRRGVYRLDYLAEQRGWQPRRGPEARHGPPERPAQRRRFAARVYVAIRTPRKREESEAKRLGQKHRNPRALPFTIS